MSDYPTEDAPRLPDRSRTDFAGSLADHVRQFATDDPMEIAVRDQIAVNAEQTASAVAQQPPAGPDGSFGTSLPNPVHEAARESQEAAPGAGDETVWQTWADVPQGTQQVLANDDRAYSYNGGLWTQVGGTQQYSHGWFVNQMAPFRPVPKTS